MSAQTKPRIARHRRVADPVPISRRAVRDYVPSRSHTVLDKHDKSKPPKQSHYHDDTKPSTRAKPAQFDVDISSVIRELTNIAFSDIREVFDDRGMLLPLARIPQRTRCAIAVYKVRRKKSRVNHGGKIITQTVELITVRLHSKLAALDALGRYYGMFDPRLFTLRHTAGSSR